MDVSNAFTFERIWIIEKIQDEYIITKRSKNENF